MFATAATEQNARPMIRDWTEPNIHGPWYPPYHFREVTKNGVVQLWTRSYNYPWRLIAEEKQ